MIELVIDDGVQASYSLEMLEKVVETSCFQAKQITKPLLCIRFAQNEDVQTLNAQWRQQDKVTDVLSFPMQDDELDAAESLGDIILAIPFVGEEAKRLDISFDAHLYHLIAHGTLHLLGFDHIEDDEAEEMQRLENKIMASLSLHTPYDEWVE
ncbi:MAG: rRNA maturation RNase YbeY [Ghiorsea sp.]